MAFSPPLWFGTLYWAQRDGSQDDPDAPLLEIRPGELDCTETARRRIFKQWEEAASWQRLMVEIIGPTFDELELALGSVDQARYLSTAEGQQLDEIGYMVGRPRGTLTDDDLYRLAIQADAATLFSSGTVPEVVSICRALLGDDMRVRQLYPATVLIRAPDVPPEVFVLLLDVLKDDLLVVGVAGILETWNSATVGAWDTSRPASLTSLGAWSTSRDASADGVRVPWSTGRSLGSLS